MCFLVPAQCACARSVCSRMTPTHRHPLRYVPRMTHEQASCLRLLFFLFGCTGSQRTHSSTKLGKPQQTSEPWVCCVPSWWYRGRELTPEPQGIEESRYGCVMQMRGSARAQWLRINQICMSWPMTSVSVAHGMAAIVSPIIAGYLNPCRAPSVPFIPVSRVVVASNLTGRGCGGPHERQDGQRQRPRPKVVHLVRN